MSVTVPLCLRGRFSVTVQTGNEYTTNIENIVPQRYSSSTGAQTYTGLNVMPGMYASTYSDGRIFRIKSTGTKTQTTLTGAILEDVDGLNTKFDSTGQQSGNPKNGGGYIFQVNSDGLPMLTSIQDTLSPQFTDSLMGRFLYDKPSSLTENFCVLTGSGTNTLAVTYDGKTFVGLGNSVFTSSGRAVAYNGTLWVAVGNGGTAIATSPDGINWTARLSRLSIGRSVAWNGSIWVAVGTGSTATIVTSTDGITWASRGKPIASDGYTVIWDGSKFLAGGTGTTTTNKLVRSVDGITWEAIDFTALSEINTLASNGVHWVVGGRQASVSLSTTSLFYSTNGGITWQGCSSSYSGAAGLALSYGARSIAWNGIMWVAVGDGISQVDGEVDGFLTVINTPRSIATSTDGITWTGQLNNYFPTSGGYGIAWNGRTWIAGGQGSSTSLITSPDGINWTDTGKLVFTTIGNGITSRRIPLLQSPLPSVYKSVQVYARGVGYNQISNPADLYSQYSRLITINGTEVGNATYSTRGLTLTIINGSTLSHISTTNYDTWSSEVNSNTLAGVLNGMTRQQIGILTSFDSWERRISGDLKTAAFRLGLSKLGAFLQITTPTDLNPIRRPYAAIFYGGGVDTVNVGTHDVIERMECTDGDAPVASVSATLVTDGTFASIVGASSTNALYSANSNTIQPSVSVGSTGTINVSGKTEILATGTYTSFTENPSNSQLTIYAKNNPNSRLYIGNYNIPGLFFSSIQSSNHSTNNGVLRDNPTTLSLNPILGADGLPGKVAIGRVNPEGGTTLDVNGYMRGKGTIVNTVCLKGANNDNWNFFASGAIVLNCPYTPVQPGRVNIVIHAGTEMAMLDGYGKDSMAYRLRVTRQVQIGRIAKLPGGVNLAVITSVLNDPTFLSEGLNVINGVTSITIPLGGNITAANAGTFTVTDSGYTSGVGLGTGYYFQYTNSNSIDATGVPLTTATLKSGENNLKRIWQIYGEYDDNYSNSTEVILRKDKISKGQDVVYVTTQVPTTIYLEFERDSDDTTAYRNAYMVVHEISNS